MVQVYKEYEELVHKDCTLFLDQASQLGYSVWSDETKELLESGTLRRDGVGLLEYGEVLVRWLDAMVAKYPIKIIFYEEVFVHRDNNPGSVAVTEKLYYMKHKVIDYGYTHRIRTLGLDNARWKKYLSDTKTFKKTANDKREVLRLVKKKLPDYEPETEDETDAVGMGIATMLNEGGNYLDVARFNKKLPIHWGISGTDWEGFKEEKLYARFQNAKDAGGIKEIPLQRTKLMDDYFKKVLTHEDVLAFTVIPPEYRNWGLYLILNNINPEELKQATEHLYLDATNTFMDEQREGTYILYASRKKRL